MGEITQGTGGGWTIRRQKGSPYFYVRFRHRGRRHEKSTGTDDRAAARTKAAEIYAATVSGRIVAVSSASPMKTLIAEWIADYEVTHAQGSADNLVDYARAHLIPFFGDLGHVTPASVGDYVRERMRNVSRSTVRKELSALRQFVAWCTERGVLREAVEIPSIPKNGHPGARARNARKREATILSAAEVERILRAMPERGRDDAWVQPFFRVLWETGLRSSTVFGLEAPLHYRKGAREIFVTREIDKTHNERRIPLTREARAALDKVAPAKGKLFAIHDYRAPLRHAVAAAKIDRPVSEYDLRHSRITLWANTPGVPLTGVQYLAGHKHLSTTARYVRAQRSAADHVLRVVLQSGVKKRRRRG